MIRRVLHSPWFHHPRIWLLLGVLFPVMAVGWFSLDRELPSKVGKQLAIPAGAPGDFITIKMPVDRDTSRKCSAVIFRQFRDSNNVTSDYSRGKQELTGDARNARESADPDYFTFGFTVPPYMPPGRAKILTDASYRCYSNPTTVVLPIEAHWEWDFDVMDKRPQQVIIINQNGQKIAPGGINE